MCNKTNNFYNCSDRYIIKKV